MANYDDQNIFARILRGEIPCQKAYEDDNALVFMDVMPQGPGHALVVPKAGSRNLLDADPASLGTLIAIVQKVAQAAVKAFDAEGVTVMQFNEPAGGQSVFHLHFHVIPRYAGIPLARHAGGAMEKPEVLAEKAARLAAALKTLS